MTARLVHASAAEVAVPAEQAFAYLADGMKQTDWALGSWNREQIGVDLFRGTSLFTGAPVYVRVTPQPELLQVDYEVGVSSDAMMRANSARVIPGEALGRDPTTCVVTLLKWRLPDQDDDAWEHACATFDTEIKMIQGRLERGF